MTKFGSLAVLLLLFTTYAQAETTPPTVLDKELLNYASTSYDKKHIDKSRIMLGLHRGTPVVADFICSDVCPDYTVRVIHYELPKARSCSFAEGVEKAVRVPVGIAATDRVFCFPRVLTDNWESYKK